MVRVTVRDVTVDAPLECIPSSCATTPTHLSPDTHKPALWWKPVSNI